MIKGNSIQQIIKDDPVELFRLLLLVAAGQEEMDDECYYEILRLRKKITNKALINNGIADLIMEIFSSGYAYPFMKLLQEHELTEILFPAINALLTVDGGHYHNELVYTHVMGALRAIDKHGKIPWFVKLAALYHDCGKYTWEISEEGKRRFLNHAQKGAIVAERDMKNLGIPKVYIGYITTLVGMHMQQLDKGHSMRKLKRVFEEANLNPKYFFWVRYADNKGSAVYRTQFMFYWNLYKQYKTAVKVVHVPSVKDLCVNGHDLMKHFNKGPGKWLGATLTYLFTGVQERGYQNEREYLLKASETFVNWYSGEK